MNSLLQCSAHTHKHLMSLIFKFVWNIIHVVETLWLLVAWSARWRVMWSRVESDCANILHLLNETSIASVFVNIPWSLRINFIHQIVPTSWAFDNVRSPRFAQALLKYLKRNKNYHVPRIFWIANLMFIKNVSRQQKKVEQTEFSAHYCFMSKRPTKRRSSSLHL